MALNCAPFDISTNPVSDHSISTMLTGNKFCFILSHLLTASAIRDIFSSPFHRSSTILRVLTYPFLSF